MQVRLMQFLSFLNHIFENSNLYCQCQLLHQVCKWNQESYFGIIINIDRYTLCTKQPPVHFENCYDERKTLRKKSFIWSDAIWASASSPPPPPSFPSKCQQQPGCLQGAGHKAEWPDHRLLGQQSSRSKQGCWPLNSRVEASQAVQSLLQCCPPHSCPSLVWLLGPGRAKCFNPHHPSSASSLILLLTLPFLNYIRHLAGVLLVPVVLIDFLCAFDYVRPTEIFPDKVREGLP